MESPRAKDIYKAFFFNFSFQTNITTITNDKCFITDKINIRIHDLILKHLFLKHLTVFTRVAFLTTFETLRGFYICCRGHVALSMWGFLLQKENNEMEQ